MKREGVVQKVNQYGDAGEQVVEISGEEFAECVRPSMAKSDFICSYCPPVI